MQDLRRLVHSMYATRRDSENTAARPDCGRPLSGLAEIMRDAHENIPMAADRRPLVDHRHGSRVRRIDLQSLVFAPLKATYMTPPTKRPPRSTNEAEIPNIEFDESPQKLFKSVAGAKAPVIARLYSRRPGIIEMRNERGETLFHNAAMHGNLDIMDFLLQCEVDINVQASATGNTALHCAVEHSQLNAIDYLVLKGARTDILNKQYLAPMHLAVEKNLITSLKELLKHRAVDIELEFDMAPPPLHYAAANDNVEAATVLLEHGANPSRANINGLSSIHVAAKSGACSCIDLLVQHAEKRGCSRQQFMNIRDRDGNVPLHAAVDSGNLESVRTCLDAGADIDVQQEDKSTPVHFACVRGELQIVQLMFEKQSSKKHQVLSMQDMNGVTPLHKAALLDHADLVEYLIEEGADPEATDVVGRTPLLLAASNSAESVVNLLIRKNVNVFHKDVDGRNFIHLSVINRSAFNVAQCGDILKQDIRRLLNDRDNVGSTPLHYASGDGLLVAIEQLLTSGAEVAVRDNNRDTPLHFAAKQGRYNTCKRLLESSQGSYIINVLDCNGCSPLFLAAENGHTRVVDFLLEKGALFHRNHSGETVLHTTAAQGHTHTIQLLLNVNSHLLNSITPDGNTALHYAAKNGHVPAALMLLNQGAEITLNCEAASFLHLAILANHKDVVLGVLNHQRWQEAMDIESPRHPFPIHYLIDQMPEACLALLDRCSKPNDKSSLHLDYAIEYDFKYLEPPDEKRKSMRDNGIIVSPLPTLNRMVRNNRVELMSHPCCRAYLKMKWETIGSKFYAFSFGLYAIYLITLTTFVLLSDPLCHDDTMNTSIRVCNHSSATLRARKSNPEPATIEEDCENSTTSLCEVQNSPILGSLCVVILVIAGLVMLFLELVRLVQQRMAYASDYCNIMSTILCVSTLVLVCPALFAGRYYIMHHFQWNAGAIALFIGWINLLLFLQRIDMVGIYIVMFLEILQTLVRVGLVFSILFLAFGFTFHILLRTAPRPNLPVHSPPFYAFLGFRTPMMATLKTLLMAVGDSEYSDTFIIPSADSHDDTMHFTSLSFIVLFLFIICIPIVVLNLLLGLSLGNIEYVLNTANLKRLSMQVQLHTEFELKVPKRLLALCPQSSIYFEFPNRPRHGLFEWLMIFLHWCGVPSSAKRPEKQSCKSSILEEIKLMRTIDADVDKVKERLRNVTIMVEKQTDMLRSIMDKMQIPSGVEEMEDDTLSKYLNERTAKSRTRKFKNAAAQMKMRATVIQRWKKMSQGWPLPRERLSNANASANAPQACTSSSCASPGSNKKTLLEAANASLAKDEESAATSGNGSTKLQTKISFCEKVTTAVV